MVHRLLSEEIGRGLSELSSGPAAQAGAGMRQLARWVSILAHPFVMVALLVAVPAVRRSSGSAVQAVLP